MAVIPQISEYLERLSRRVYRLEQALTNPVNFPTGIGYVFHGNDPTVPRPNTHPVYIWGGTVKPDNWSRNIDFWIDTTGVS